MGGVGACARDVAVSGAGGLMCAWLLWHGGWVWNVVASAVGALGAIWLIG
jgi:hypothetical protein